MGKRKQRFKRKTVKAPCLREWMDLYLRRQW